MAKYSLLLIVSGLLFQTCVNRPATSSLEYYSGYVTSYSQGPVSRCQDVFVQLGFNVDRSVRITSDLITFQPKLNGTLELDSTRDRIVIVNADIKHNITYHARLNIGRLTEMPKGMEYFDFEFEAKRQTWNLTLDPPINKSMDETTFVGSVEYVDCEPNLSVFYSSLSASQGGRPLVITWKHDKDLNRSSGFTITGAKRTDEPDIVKLRLTMDAINVDDEVQLDLPVPSRSDFSLHSIKTGSNTHIQIVFTDPLQEGQDLTGLISVEGRRIKQMKVRYNAINVFFEGENFGYFDIVIHPGIVNAASFQLKDNYTRKLFFAPPIPSVAIAVPGNILPPDGQWKVPVTINTATGFRFRILEINQRNAHRFYQENKNPYDYQTGLENLGRIVLDTVYKVEVDNVFGESTHTIAIDRLVARQKGAIYKLFLSIPAEHNAYPCVEASEGHRPDLVDQIDFDRPWLSRYYIYYGHDQLGMVSYNKNQDRYSTDPCATDFARRIHDQRVLVCTDVAMVIKSMPDSDAYLVYLSGISTADPISNGKIVLFNFQGEPIATSFTDEDGFAKLHTSLIPFIAKAEFHDQVTYIPLSEAKALSLSTFQVEGKSWDGGTKILLYGDRDVWRPGDSIFMQAIVYDGIKAPPANLPVRLALYDPTNKLVRRWNVTRHTDGLYDCRFNTAPEAPTGNWRLEVVTGGTKHSTAVRVETIRPNRLKMEMAFDNPKLLTTKSSTAAPITVQWMHGMAGNGLATEIRMFQKVLDNPFGDQYTGFVFDHKATTYSRDLRVVYSGKTSSLGIIDFDIPTQNPISYPSMMIFNFDLRVFEPGGAFSTDMKDIRYSPFSSYVGMKLPQGKTYLQTSDPIQLICLDEEGQRRSGKVRISISEIAWSWWYQFGRRGNFSAIKSNIKKYLRQEEITVGIEGVVMSLDTPGRMLIEVTDLESGHTVSRVVYGYNKGHWNSASTELSHLEVLPLHLEQTRYTTGDIIDFELPPVGSGRYLITLESGGDILFKKQLAVQATPVHVQIPVTSEMTPTAYLHVHFIQAWKTHTNHRPLRLFGIQALEIYDPATVLTPVISMKDEIEADREFEINVTEQEGRPMSYTLAIVDEGLLQLTQFKTPNPWTSFYAKERLDVRTWDIYRQIFHRFQGESNSLLAVGGDGVNVINPTAKVQRFKPVVRFIGPVKLAPGASISHKINISDYVGAVRVMVVATNGVAVGKANKSVEVKKPLMLYSTLPRVLGPGERLKVPVTLFVMEDDISSVDISIASDQNITFLGEERRSVQFDKQGEKDIYFEIEVGEKTGPVVITTTAKSGIHIATERIEIDVRPSSPVITKTIENMIAPGEEVNIDFEPIGMIGTWSSKMTISKGLNFSFQSYAEWLERYPHGCLEQSVSSVFPQIFLSQMNLLDDAAQLRSRQNYEAVIQKLRYMQLPNGGFSYWSGGNIPNSWGTTYALNFLLEAKNLGYRVPEDLLSKCIQYQYKTADSWSVRSTYVNRTLQSPVAMDQAYRLYTLVLAGRPNYAALNRLRLVPRLSSSARWLLSHSLLLVGEERAAEQAIGSALASIRPYREFGNTFGSNIRDQAMIIRVLLARGEKLKAKRLIDEMTQYFSDPNGPYLSTQDVAQCLISFAMFNGSLAQVEDTAQYQIKLSEKVNSLDGKIIRDPASFALSEEDISSGNITIRNTGTQYLFSSLEISGLPARDETAKEMQDLRLRVEYYSSNGVIVPNEMPKGSDFIVHITVTHPGERAKYENMALTAIFPSGWEIINDRLNQNTRDANIRSVDYMDIRDDRVNLYFDLEKGRSKTFKFKLNATYAGRYWSPPVFCEAMYDGSVRAKTEGFWVEVKSLDK